MTVMAWIKPRSAGGSGGKGHIVGKENNDSGPGDGQWALSLSGTSNRLTFGHSRATQPIAAYANNAWVTDTWQHVAVTFNGGTVASTAIHIYANGTELSHAYDQDGSGAYSTDATASLLIGGGYSAGNGWNFDGLIDDVRVYNRVLSATEIAELYKSFGGKTIVASSGNDVLRSGLVGQWSMDGQDVNWADTTTEIKDRSGNANHGDATNMSSVSVAPGRIGQALRFDGTDDDISIADAPVLDFGAGAAFSYAGWFNLDAVNGNEPLVMKSANDISQGYGLFIHTTDLFNIMLNDATDDCSDYVDLNTTLTGAWHHYVWSVDTSHISRLYVDGSLRLTTDCSVSGDLSNADDLYLGWMYSGTSQYFSGKQDDVRIYNRALSANEVTQLYNMGR
jgi:hypothetical protein